MLQGFPLLRLANRKMKKIIVTFSIFLAVVLVAAGVAFAESATSTNYKVVTGDTAAKGYASSTNYKVYSVTGQGGVVGVPSSSSYKVQAGLVRRYATTSDSDGDGCDDVKELGSNPALGGQRDPYYQWDFFDVSGDKSIDLTDALEILEHFGQNPGDPGYDQKYDRDAPDEAKLWKTVASATGIDLTDVLVNLQSFGHGCE